MGEDDLWDDDIEDEDDDDADLLCQMRSDGHCGAVGSEYCEFECPYRHEW